MNIKNTAIYSCNNDCISEINNTQVDNAKYIDVIMPRYTDGIPSLKNACCLMIQKQQHLP